MWVLQQAAPQLPRELPEVAEPGSSLWVTLPSPRTFGQPEEPPKLPTPGQPPLLFSFIIIIITIIIIISIIIIIIIIIITRLSKPQLA